MGKGKEHRVGLLRDGFGCECLERQRNESGQAGKDRGDGTAGGFFRGDCNQFEVRMGGGEADEFRSGISACTGDGDTNLSHHSPRTMRVASNNGGHKKKGRPRSLPFFSIWLRRLALRVLEPLSCALLTILLPFLDARVPGQ